jgi:TRAP-type transport system periplasmic protein
MTWSFWKQGVAGLALATVALHGQAQERIRIAGNFAPDHSSSISMQQFKKDVEAASKGTLVVEVFDNMQLGGAQENVTQTRAGTIHMTWVGMAFLSRTVPELEAVSLPFLFPSREVAYKVMDGPVGDAIEARMAAKGFTSLGFMELGPRQVTNSVRPIKTMADLKGLKIRLQPNETHLATFRALGANPLAMDIKEVYSALEQKVIDGHENANALILTSRFFEVQKYLSNTAHFFDFISVVANKKKFDALSPEHRKIVQVAMNAAIASQRSAAAKADAEALIELQKKGMVYTAMPESERDLMRKATASVVDDIRKRVGSELVDQVLAEVKKNAK